MSLTTRVLIALVAGLVAGLLIDPDRSAFEAGVVSAADTIGSMWVNAIRMTVVPLVVSLLITGVAAAADPRVIRTVGLRAFGTFLGLLALSAVFALLLVPLLFTWLAIDPATSDALRTSASASTAATGTVPTLTEFLVSIVPVNPVKAAADGAMLPLVVFSLAFGLALLKVPDESRARVLSFFKALGEAMLVIVRWIIAVAPLGVFALMLPMASRTGVATAGALTYYMVAMAAACTLLIALLYVVVAVVARVPVPRFARGVFPAQAVAVSSSSSLASLPALIEGAEQRLGLPPSISGVVLPLAVSMFKVTSPVVWSVAALFLAQLYGVPLSLNDRLIVVVTAGLSSFSVPGIPHGWLLILSTLLVSINVPVAGVALLWAVDAIPDMFATTANVTADMAAATIVGRKDLAAQRPSLG